MRIRKLITIVAGTVSVAFLTVMSPVSEISRVYAEETMVSQTANEKAVSDEAAVEKTDDASEKEAATDDKKTEENVEKEAVAEDKKAEESSEKEAVAEDKKAEESTEKEVVAEDKKADENSEKEVVAEDKKAEDTAEKTDEVQQLSEEEQAAKEREDARKALQNDPNHVHNFKWIARMNESESAEGTMNYICEECGKVWFFRPIPAYDAFQGSLAHRISTAPEGENISIKTSHFISFTKQVMKALSDRPDVSLTVSFLDQEYKGNRVSFTIPAGEDTMSLVDDNGYVGFLFLGGKYGLTLEEAAEPVEIEGTAETAESVKDAEPVETDKAAEAVESVKDTETVGTAKDTASTEVQNAVESTKADTAETKDKETTEVKEQG